MMKKKEELPYDGFLSYSRSKGIQRRVTLLVEKAQEKGLKLCRPNEKVGHGGIVDQMDDGVLNAEFFLPIITEDYVSKVEGDRLDKVTENSQFEANMGMIHRGVWRTIPIIMEANMEDKTKWGKILGRNFGYLLFVKCFRDEDVEKAAESLVWQMKNAKERKHVVKTNTFESLTSTNVNEVQGVARGKAKEYVEGTRLWIYNRMQNGWLIEKDWTQVFVLLGCAGIGKSVCLANICERGNLFQRRNVYKLLANKKMIESPFEWLYWIRTKYLNCEGKHDFIVVACHFFKHDDSRSRGAKACIMSLAAQMRETVPYFAEYCACVSNAVDVESIDTKELFRRVVAEPLQMMEYDKVSPPRGIRAFVVVDALDECKTEDRAGLLDILQTLWREIVPTWLGICVSSRPEDYIPPRLAEFQPTILSTENKANLKDMRVYLTDKFEKHFSHNKGKLKALVEIVLDRSKGHFLYARFIEEYLSRVEKLSLREVKNANLFSGDLNWFYQDSFQRMFDKVGKEKYHTLLSSMCFAREPLPIDVVENLLGLSDKEVELLLKKMTPLLVVTDDSVRFVHKSIADFLVDDNKCTNGELLVGDEEGMNALATYCQGNYLDSAFAAKQLVYHVQNIDQTVISELLCDFQKLHQLFVGLRINHRSFISDLSRYYHDEDSNAQLVVRALEKSLNGLDNDPRELRSQLLGRIDSHNHPVLKTMVDVDYSYLRPVAPCLTNSQDPLPMTLYGHGGVFAVAMNEEMIVSGSGNSTIKICSRATGECLKTLEGHSDWVRSVAICDDVIVSGSQDRTVKVWSLKSGECLKTLEGHSEIVTSVVICDGVIVSGSNDNTVKFWSLQSGECLKTLEGHSYSVKSVAICDDVIVSGSNDETVKVWSFRSGKCLKTLYGHSERVNSVAICDDVIVSGSLDRTIMVWSLSRGECLKTLEGHSGSVYSVAICDDVIVSGSDDKTVKVWSLNSGECLETLEGHSDVVFSVTILDDVIVSGSNDETVKVWILQSDECLRSFERHSNRVSSLAICGDVIVSGSGDSTVKVWSLKSGECLKTLEGHSFYVRSVAICDDVIVSASDDTTVKVWSLKSGECLKTLEGHSYSVTSVAICDDVIVSGSADGTVKVWSLKSGECLKTLEGHSFEVTSVAICDDVIVSGSHDKTVKVWSLKSGECLKTMEGHSRGVNSVAICDDVIVSGSDDKTVKVWSLKSGECLKTLEGHSDDVYSVAIFDDVIISKSSNEAISWSRSSLNRWEADQVSSISAGSSSRALWAVDGNRISLPEVEVGFTMDTVNREWEASNTHIACFDQRHVLHLLEIVKQ